VSQAAARDRVYVRADVALHRLPADASAEEVAAQMTAALLAAFPSADVEVELVESAGRELGHWPRPRVPQA
jgi:hypothetical protein